MNWRIVIGTVIGVVLFVGYSRLRHRDDGIVVSNTAPEQPGYYLKDAALVQTDSDSGQPSWRLHASTITRDPRTENVHLEQVKLDYLSAGSTAWLLTAQRGYIPKDSRVVTFSDAVNIQPQGEHVTMPMTLRTDELRIDTQSHLATAPGKVTIQMNQQQLTAVGLKADLTNQKVRLLTQVRGEFRSQSAGQVAGQSSGNIQ